MENEGRLKQHHFEQGIQLALIGLIGWILWTIVIQPLCSKDAWKR
jgi:hypothetical protein